MTTDRHWVAALGALVLVGCGGGGSSGPSAPAPQASYVTPPPYTQNEAIAALAPTLTGTATSFSVAPALPAGLTLNASTGTISGTPTAFARDTDYTITVTGPGGTTASHLHLVVQPRVPVSRLVAAGTSVYPVVTLDGDALGLSGSLFAQVTDAGGLFSGRVTVTSAGSRHSLELSTLDTASAGPHSGQASISLCRDAACSSLQPMPKVLVTYDVNVVAANGAWPGNHLTTLAALPGAPDWSTFQGNAAHTGYVPVTLDPNQASTRWQVPVPAFNYFNGRFNLASVTTEGGRLFSAGANAVTARSEHDGATLWTYSFAGLQAPSVNPPAVKDGTVYVAAGQNSSTTMFGFDARDGAVRFRTGMASQWENYLAPTVGPSGVYTNAGTYGGLYAFDKQGTSLFFGSTAQQSTWTPAVDARAVYAYTGSSLRVFHPVTGALQADITDPTFTNYIYEIGGSAVLGAPNSVFAAAYGNSFLNSGGIGNYLVHFNLQTSSVDWKIRGVYPTTPAYDGGVVYIPNNNPLRLEARAEGDGALQWSWTPQSSSDLEFVSEVILTQNAVIVSTNSATYALDRSTRRPMWSYPAAGKLALSANGVLYIVAAGGLGTATTTITAINLR